MIHKINVTNISYVKVKSKKNVCFNGNYASYIAYASGELMNFRLVIVCLSALFNTL